MKERRKLEVCLRRIPKGEIIKNGEETINK